MRPIYRVGGLYFRKNGVSGVYKSPNIPYKTKGGGNMGFVTSEGLDGELCKIFGLDPGKVKDISISNSAGSVSVVDVRMYIFTEEGELLKEALRHYKLEKI